MLALDVLRGFALCGILLANVKPIAHAGAAFRAVTSTGASEATPWLHLLVDQRFFPIFSVLFGVGFWLLFAGVAKRSARPRLVLLRRLLVLLAVGLAHMLLWPGDILSVYAVVGVLVLLPSTWLPRWAVAGLAVALLAASVLLGHGGTAARWSPDCSYWVWRWRDTAWSIAWSRRPGCLRRCMGRRRRARFADGSCRRRVGRCDEFALAKPSVLVTLQAEEPR